MATRVHPAARALADAYVLHYPGEVAEELEQAELEDVVAFLESRETREAGAVLERMVERLATDVLERMSAEALPRVLSAIDPARAAVLLSRLDEDVREERMALLPTRFAAELRELMTYPEDSAGHLMETRLLTFSPETTVKETIARVREEGSKRYNLLVVDEEGVLTGLVPVPDLVHARPGVRLGQLIATRPPSVTAMAPRDEVLEVLERGDVRVLPVVDAYGKLLGVIRQEGLVQAVREEAAADLSTMVGGSKDERALSTPWFAVKKRLPWLNINLLTAFVAAAVVGLFESTIAQFTALAVLLPVVAGQSGNTGAQALAVVMRGLALREIRVSHWAPVLMKEGVAGALNGVAIAAVTSAGVYVWSQSWGLCLVIAVAMVVSMVIAAVSGAAIPLVLTLLRQDPAQSGSIILTTVTDVMGFFSFLGLATLLSGLL